MVAAALSNLLNRDLAVRSKKKSKKKKSTPSKGQSARLERTGRAAASGVP